ncbi:MAG TPA: TonB-dependent receptor [Vicinamibacterales bacterium]|nr:TonB-dependent receptor [Vicinamibacterales bacterium]
MSRLLLSFLLTLTISAQASAQAPLAGRIVDPQGQPVAAATVVAVGATSAPVSATTDTQGRFEFPALSEGRYDLTASAPGLSGEVRGVTAGSVTPLEIRLRVAAISETLIVSAAQIDQPLSRTADSVTVVSGRELEARQVTTLAGALSTVPGFTVARTGGPGTLTSLFPRGGDSDFTLVLIDGIRANAFGGGIDLSQVPLTDVERVEVVRGPQSAIFGADAIGGVVQIITRHGGAPTATAVIETGSRDTRRLQASTTGARRALRWQAGADYFEDAGFTGVAANGERVGNDDAHERQVWLGGGWQASRGTDLQGTFRYVDTERGAPGPYGSDPAGRFFGVDRISRGNSERRAVGARLVHPWTGPASRVRQRVEFDVADYDFGFLSAFGRSASETRRTHARIQTDAALDGGAGISAGLEWLDERARSSFIQQGGAEVPVERRVVGTFAEGRWNGHERLSLQAGMRVEHITREAFAVNGFADDAVTSINPKVSVSWLVSRSLPGARHWTRVRAAAGTGIRPPDVFEIAFTDNPALRPERSRSIEAGVTQALAAGAVQLDATTFFNRYDDLIVSVGSLRDVSRYRTDNVSNARARGVELGAAWQSARGIGARAAYTFLDTEIHAVDNSAQAPSPYRVGDRLLRRPRHSGSVALTWTRDRITMFTTLDSRGEALDAEPSFGPSGGLYQNTGRTVADLGGSVRMVRNVAVFARVMNALDRDYEEVFGFPSPGRTAFVGVRVASRR